MTSTARSLRAFLDASPSVALVEVAEAKGSTPREKGAWMLVSPERIFGTIGGGQLEFMAIDKAREMLGASPLRGGWPEGPGGGGSAGQDPRRNPAEGGAPRLHPHPSATPTPSPQGGGLGAALTLDIPLGPEIGQCCGGRVEVSIKLVDGDLQARLIEHAEAEDARLPHVYLFGGGHVGHALASAFALLPVRVVVVETRADALDGTPETIETRLTPVPEEMVRDARPARPLSC